MENYLLANLNKKNVYELVMLPQHLINYRISRIVITQCRYLSADLPNHLQKIITNNTLHLLINML